MDRDGRSRRDVLRATAGVGSVALCGTLAGCATQVPALDESLPWYATWIPRSGPDPEWVATLDLGRVRERSRTVPDAVTRTLRRTFDARWSPFESPDRIDRVAAVGDGADATPVWILKGHLDARRAVTRLADGGYRVEATYEGFDVLRAPDAPWVAVDSGTALVAPAEGSPGDRIRTLVDARREDRRATGDDRTDDLLSTVGTGLSTAVELAGSAPVAVGRGARIRVPSFGVARAAFVLRAPDADPASVEDRARDPDSAFPAMRDVRAERDGDLVRVEGRVGPERIRVVGAARVRLRPGFAPPDATFTFRYLDRTLRIIHDGGQAFTPTNADALTYGSRGGPRTQWPLPVTDGDAVELTAPEDFEGGDAVTLVWKSTRGRREEVAAFEVPP